MRNYEKLIAMYIIQLICQPRLFATDRLSRCIKVTGCPPRENVQGTCVLDAFKTSSDINKTLIQTSSGTGKAKKQNAASKDNFSSLNRFFFFISERTMMFISLDVKYRPCPLSSITFAVSFWFLNQTKGIHSPAK